MALKEGLHTAKEYFGYLKEKRGVFQLPHVYNCESLDELVNKAKNNNVTTIAAYPRILRIGFDVATQEREYGYKISLGAQTWKKCQLEFRQKPVNVLEDLFLYELPGGFRFSVDKEGSNRIGFRAWAGVEEDEKNLPAQQKCAHAQMVKAAEEQLEILRTLLPDAKIMGVEPAYSDLSLGEFGALNDREDFLIKAEEIKIKAAEMVEKVKIF
jgi:hypothetical protein